MKWTPVLYEPAHNILHEMRFRSNNEIVGGKYDPTYLWDGMEIEVAKKHYNKMLKMGIGGIEFRGKR